MQDVYYIFIIYHIDKIDNNNNKCGMCQLGAIKVWGPLSGCRQPMEEAFSLFRKNCFSFCRRYSRIREKCCIFEWEREH